MSSAEEVRASAEILVNAHDRCQRGEIGTEVVHWLAEEHRKVLKAYAPEWKRKTGKRLFIPADNRRLITVVVRGRRGY